MPTKSLPWFRLYTEIRTDPKMQMLSDQQFRIWINLLCLAAESPERGVIHVAPGKPYPIDALARMLQGDTGALQGDTGALHLFEYLGLIQQTDDGIVVVHFTERQYDKPSDSPEAIRKRVSRSREAQKAPDSNTDTTTDVTRTYRPGNAPDVDTDSISMHACDDLPKYPLLTRLTDTVKTLTGGRELIGDTDSGTLDEAETALADLKSICDSIGYSWLPEIRNRLKTPSAKKNFKFVPAKAVEIATRYAINDLQEKAAELKRQSPGGNHDNGNSKAWLDKIQPMVKLEGWD